MGTTDAMLLLGAGLLAGAMNAAAGGGSFVTLPALVTVGVPSVEANASSTVALFSGGLASALAIIIFIIVATVSAISFKQTKALEDVNS